jgi:hypothetical protein
MAERDWFGWDLGVYGSTPERAKEEKAQEERIAVQEADASDSKLRMSMIEELVQEFGISRDFLNDKTVGELKDIFRDIE